MSIKTRKIGAGREGGWKASFNNMQKIKKLAHFIQYTYENKRVNIFMDLEVSGMRRFPGS